MFKIIGITGPAQCGKDTVADHICIDSNYRKTSFADPIKEMLGEGLELHNDQLYGKLKDVVDNRYGCTPRHMLQTLGTEWGRELINGNIWVIVMESYLRNIGGTFVIPDIRFENEAALVRKYGRLIHIKGREDNIEAGADHISEAGVSFGADDLVIHNVRDINNLLGCAEELLNVIDYHKAL